MDGVRLRPYRRADLPGMVEVWNQRVAAEGEGIWATEEWFAESYDHLVRCDPETDIVVAEDADGVVVGYAKVTWDDVAAGYRSYPLAFAADSRVDGLEARLLDWAADRARAVAAGHAVPDRRLDAQATDGTPRERHLLDRGFVATTRWGFMVRDLADIPHRALPDGLTTRRVAAADLPAIWQAHVEGTRDDPDFVEPTEDDRRAFLDEASEGTDLWKVAWDGDDVVGQVRTRPAADADNARRGRRRAWTEDISTRPEWRRRGVASALICASLRQLAELGYEEAALGADYVSPTNARRLYERLGYRESLSMTSHQFAL